MSQGPCLNPNCKSHGQPHPNCRCYGGMADGGKVTYYCDSARQHEAGCEYFADGGEALLEASTLIQPTQPQLPDASTLQEPNPLPEAEDLVTPEQHAQQQAATTLGQQALTGLEGVGRAVIPGFDMAMTAPRAAAQALGVPDEYLDYVGPSKEQLLARQEANPMISHGAEAAGLIGSLVTGTGLAGLAGKAGQIAEKGAERLAPKIAATAMGKIGSAALKGGIETSLITANDEIGNAFLHDVNPQDAVVPALLNVGASGLLGLGSGGLFGAGNVGLKALGEGKAGKKAMSFLAGLGSSADDAPKLNTKPTLGSPDSWWNKLHQEASSEIDKSAYNLGKKIVDEKLPELGKAAANNMSSTIGVTAGGTLGGIAGNVIGGPTGAVSGASAGAVLGKDLANKYLGPHLETIIGGSVNGAAKKVVPWIALKTMANGDALGAWRLLDYASQVSKGETRLTKAVDSLFKGTGEQAVEALSDAEKRREKLRSFIENGGLEQQITEQVGKTENTKNNEDGSQHTNPPGFAEGGEVTKTSMPPTNPEVNPVSGSETLARHYPSQNMMLQSAKGAVSGYLNSIRPNQFGKQSLPYDKQFKDKHAERSYDEALDLANHPLSVLNHIQNGSLQLSHVKHISQMYPEVYQHLSKKLTERMVKDKQDESKTPPYHVRQALSLFLGSPLESSFTPQSIMAAQPKPQGQPQPQGKPKKASAASTKSLNKMSNSYKTPSQEAESDRSARD